MGRTPRRKQNRKSHGRKEKQTDGRPRDREAPKRAPWREREVGRAVTSRRAGVWGGQQGAAAGRAWLGAPPLTLVAACFPPRLRFPHLLRA